MRELKYRERIIVLLLTAAAIAWAAAQLAGEKQKHPRDESAPASGIVDNL